MGLFHKRIKEMRELVEDGKYKEAEKILVKHITEEHQANSDITRLMRLLAKYQQELVELSDIFGSKIDEKDKMENSIQKIDELEADIVQIKELISNLKRTVKIRLE